MEKNIQLLKDTLDWIKANPKTHNQGEWGHYDEEACETSMCFAGHAAILAGGTFDKDIYLEEGDWTVNSETGQHVPTEYALTDEGDGWVDDEELKPGTEHVADFAARRLGLEADEKGYMFSGLRSLDDLEQGVDFLSRGYTYVYDHPARDWAWVPCSTV